MIPENAKIQLYIMLKDSYQTAKRQFSFMFYLKP